MIISFNPNLFSSQDEKTSAIVSQIFDILQLDRFKINILSIWEILYSEDGQYIFDDTPFAQKYLSQFSRSRLKEYIETLIQMSGYITELHEKYLSQIVIGQDNGNTKPVDALGILTHPSKVIVENATNDWKFIRSICKKYEKHSRRKSIYRIVQRAIENNWLVAEQAGGRDQIIVRIADLVNNTYRHIYKVKLMALFDSDRNDNTYINNEQKRIIEYIKGASITTLEQAVYHLNDMIIWHMLYKRELENYVPLSVVTEEIKLSDSTIQLLLLTDVNDYDFLNFELRLKDENVDVKKEFPNLFFVNFTRDKFEQRCEHHKINIELPNNTLESVSEIEEILLKISRIV